MTQSCASPAAQRYKAHKQRDAPMYSAWPISKSHGAKPNYDRPNACKTTGPSHQEHHAQGQHMGMAKAQHRAKIQADRHKVDHILTDANDANFSCKHSIGLPMTWMHNTWTRPERNRHQSESDRNRLQTRRVHESANSDKYIASRNTPNVPSRRYCTGATTGLELCFSSTGAKATLELLQPAQRTPSETKVVASDYPYYGSHSPGKINKYPSIARLSTLSMSLNNDVALAQQQDSSCAF